MELGTVSLVPASSPPPPPRPVEAAAPASAPSVESVTPPPVGLRVDRGRAEVVVENVNREPPPDNPALARRTLSFTFDEELSRITTSVVNTETKEVIRSVPSPEAMSFAKKFQAVVGEIFDAVA
ncbi:MAG: flagellar protein FlaG [Planctomycetes bacterium]|nr:flagellar protein FlaG [Planctomycetota bacterium]